ncbi:MAG: hypothetical protein BZ136_01905 [Methanosphaera sp. rholeuAM74]|nr:MAG: hypothetical protein BZ136_01905 [Methanosphaera sp. rholeuAM74]
MIVDSVSDKFKIILVILLSLFTIISYTHVSYMVTELAFTLVVLLLHSCLKENTLDLDLMMILWMGIFVILHSYHPVKVDRYIIPALIPLTYYMINTTKTISKKIKHEKTATIILVIILVLFIPVNASYLNSIAQPNPHSLEERHSYQWLENYDQNYRDYNISSDRGVAYSWYLKKYVYTSIPRVLQTTNQTLEDKLKEVNAKYYIDSTSYTDKIEGYHEIYNNNNTKYQVKIYEKNGEN